MNGYYSGVEAMFDNGRKNICVILCEAAAHYQEQVCRTLTSYARDKGYNLAYFTFFVCYGVYTKNGMGEANIINLVPYENFDGFIICHDTIQNKQAVKQIFAYIKERTRKPVVTLRRAWEDYPCILAENKGAIKEIVQHFVDVHHFDRIAFFSGPKDHPDAITRLADYKEGLASRGIDYDEKYVFYGDFWRKLSKEAAQYFITKLPEIPQAVVCANDYMALSLCNELVNFGKIVPKDIAVSGFDDIWEATINMPPVTTVTMPVEKMSELAFETLERMMNGGDVPRVQTLRTVPVIRDSCGCQGMDMETAVRKRVRQSQEYEKILDLIRYNTYTFVEMSDVQRAQELVNHTRLLEVEDNYIKNFFICLGEGEGRQHPKYCSEKNGYPKQSQAVGAAVNGAILQTETAVFDTSDLLPREAVEQEPMIYYFFPLHNLNITFGYFAISYEGTHSCGKSFHSWLAILGNVLENMRLRQKTNALLDELNNMYVHDVLTGLLNRRGFEINSQEFYEKSRTEKRTLAIISIDMDNLKIVNDKFGHKQGDIALQTIGKAILHAAEPGDICARIGGDEFSVAGMDYNEQKAQGFVEKFDEYLEKFNRDSGRPYLVGASCGWYLVSAFHGISLEAAIVKSDEHLYETKREKKKDHRDCVLREKEA